jgi:hypothetical protein
MLTRRTVHGEGRSVYNSTATMASSSGTGSYMASNSSGAGFRVRATVPTVRTVLTVRSAVVNDDPVT